MRLMLLLLFILSSCTTSTEKDPYASGYGMTLKHRFPPFVAKELEAEFPELLFIADGRTCYVWAIARDESAIAPELRAKLKSRKDELDRSESAPSVK